VRVADLLTEKPCNGLSVKGESKPPGVPALRLSAISANGIDYGEVRYLPVEPHDVAHLFVRAGDFLVCRGNGTLGNVGRGVLVEDVPFAVIFPDTMIRLRLRADLVSARWLKLAWQTPQVRDQVERRARTTAGIYKISQGDLLELALELPPRAVQDALVERVESALSLIDAGVAGLRRAATNLKNYRAAVLKAACEGRLLPTEAEFAARERRPYEPADQLLARILDERRARWERDQLAKMKARGALPKDDKWRAKYQTPPQPELDALPGLPEGWRWTTVETVGDVLLGRQRAPQYLTGKWPRPYLRVANVKDDALDLSDVEEMDFDPVHFEKYRLEPGDILVSEGQSPELVGQSAIYGGQIEGLCFQKTLHRFRAISPGPSAKFAQIVFRSHVKNGVFQRMASITTNIAHLTLEKFVAAPFPLPPVAEQERIVREVDRLMSFADDVERSIRANLVRARELRRAVLREAFNGGLVPPPARSRSARPEQLALPAVVTLEARP
jgi:type I restriction enzyme S subunit